MNNSVKKMELMMAKSDASLSFKMPKHLKEELTRRADEKNMTLSNYIRMICVNHIVDDKNS